jgi:hypothetical protein
MNRFLLTDGTVVGIELSIRTGMLIVSGSFLEHRVSCYFSTQRVVLSRVVKSEMSRVLEGRGWNE